MKRTEPKHTTPPAITISAAQIFYQFSKAAFPKLIV